MNIVKLPPLESQHTFPFEDLKECNAGSLAVTLANCALVDTTHIGAEGMRWLFRVGHPTLARLAHTRYEDDTTMITPLSHGIAMMEACSVLVAAEGMEDSGQVTLMAGGLLTLTPDQIARYFDEAFEQFRDKMPRACEVIKEGAEYQFGHLAERALLGAALTWRFELDVKTIP